jgi:hypothetical protein
VNFVVIGTDHRFQAHDPGLEAILRTWIESRFVEPLSAIAEEYHDQIGSSVAQRLAAECRIKWFNIDMTMQEKHDAGILNEQAARPGLFHGTGMYRIPSDDVREDAWVEKLTQATSDTTIVICGYLHCEPLVQKLRVRATG